MALDLEEQEQLDALKRWWAAHGRRVLLGVALFVALVGGWRGYLWYEARQNREAAALFGPLAEAWEKGDARRVRELAGNLIDEYPRTPYAVDVAFLAARTNYQNGDSKSAKAQLQWIVEHARDRRSVDVARLNLSGILLDEKDYAGAARLLEATHDPAFDALYADRRGDVLAAQGKADEARAAYRQALGRLPPDAPLRGLLELKLEALGARG